MKTRIRTPLAWTLLIVMVACLLWSAFNLCPQRGAMEHAGRIQAEQRAREAAAASPAPRR
jgi:hypothetical protein